MIKVGSKYRIVFPIELIADHDTLHNKIGTVVQKLDDESYNVSFEGDPEQYIIYADELKSANSSIIYVAYNAINDPED